MLIRRVPEIRYRCSIFQYVCRSKLYIFQWYHKVELYINKSKCSSLFFSEFYYNVYWKENLQQCYQEFHWYSLNRVRVNKNWSLRILNLKIQYSNTVLYCICTVIHFMSRHFLTSLFYLKTILCKIFLLPLSCDFWYNVIICQQPILQQKSQNFHCACTSVITFWLTKIKRSKEKQNILNKHH